LMLGALTGVPAPPVPVPSPLAFWLVSVGSVRQRLSLFSGLLNRFFIGCSE